MANDIALQLGKALAHINYLTNSTASWYEAHDTRSQAEENIDKLVTVETLLEEIICSLKDHAIFRVVIANKDGGLSAKQFDSEKELLSELKKLGINKTGICESKRVREILRGKPTFDKLHGPMYDGGNCVRYENQDAYNILST